MPCDPILDVKLILRVGANIAGDQIHVAVPIEVAGSDAVPKTNTIPQSKFGGHLPK